MFAYIREYNETIETGRDILLPLTHNIQSTPRPSCPSQDRYGQLIEPMGLFTNLGHNGINGQTDGHMTVVHMTRSMRPLIIQAVARDGMNACKSWKQDLSDRYGGKTGLDLTRAVMLDGYTAIITVDAQYEPGEIVLLNMSKDEFAALQRR